MNEFRRVVASMYDHDDKSSTFYLHLFDVKYLLNMLKLCTAETKVDNVLYPTLK